MNSFLFIVNCFLFVIATASVIWFLGSLISLLGEKDTFFSTIKEGQVKVSRRGGIATFFFGKIKDHTIDEKTGEIIKGKDTRPEKFWEKKLGVRWIGLYPWNTIYHYRFRWNKWAKPVEKTDYEIVPRDEIVDSVYFRAPYALKLVDLETSDRLGVTSEIVFTIKMKNIKTALFLTSDWLANTSAEISAAIRDFFGQRNYNDLIVMQNEINSKSVSGAISEFVSAIKTLNTSGFGNEALPDKFGVEIDDISLLSIEIGEPKGELAKATHKKYVADREAEVVKVAAEAEASKIRVVAEADAKKIELLDETTAGALRKLHEALGMDGDQIGLVKLAGAIDEAGTQTVVLGGGTASPILGINNPSEKKVKIK